MIFDFFYWDHVYFREIRKETEDDDVPDGIIIPHGPLDNLILPGGRF